MIGGLLTPGAQPTATNGGLLALLVQRRVAAQQVAARGPIDPGPGRGPTPTDLGRKRLPNQDKFFSQFGKPQQSPPKPPPDDAQDEQREQSDAQQNRPGLLDNFSQLLYDVYSAPGRILQGTLKGEIDTTPPGIITSNTEEAIAKKVIGGEAVLPVKILNWLLGRGTIDPMGTSEIGVPDANAPRSLTPQQRVDPTVASYFQSGAMGLTAGVITGAARPAVVIPGGADGRHEQAQAALDEAGAVGQIVATVVFPGWKADP